MADSLLQADSKLLGGQGGPRGRGPHRGRGSTFLNGSQLFVVPVRESAAAEHWMGARLPVRGGGPYLRTSCGTCSCWQLTSSRSSDREFTYISFFPNLWLRGDRWASGKGAELGAGRGGACSSYLSRGLKMFHTMRMKLVGWTTYSAFRFFLYLQARGSHDASHPFPSRLRDGPPTSCRTRHTPPAAT